MAYHDASKHHVSRFARSAGYLDWATQPDPFRRFEGVDLIDLVAPLARAVAAGGASRESWDHIDYDRVFQPATGPRLGPGLEAVAVLLRYSLGLSAWKSTGGQRWALRVNPSSGNLHPTEAYVVAGADSAAGPAGVFHYRPDAHALERRCAAPPDAWAAFADGLPDGSFFVALTSIHWREAWKYGERAFRYCQHDTGHAIAALRVAAAMMGWHARLVAECASGSLARLLGLDRDDDFADAEREEPECLLMVAPQACATPAGPCTAAAGEAFAAGDWRGRASRLSPGRVDWPAIDAVAAATRVPETAGSLTPAPLPAAGGGVASVRGEKAPRMPASRLLLQRRSAVAMTGGGAMSLDSFVFLLRRLLPGAAPPWDALWWRPRVHLVLFVHRVTGLEPGLYVLARSPGSVETLRGAMREDFAWLRPEAVAADVPLFLLGAADVRALAAALSCGQAIAADGCFAVAALAEFDEVLARDGAWAYRQLFWEAGVVGQVLYLEAEAAGLRGTGIGCYFDDPVHEVLGIAGHGLQSVYHFTVGWPEEDSRLRVESGYGWEARGDGSGG